jgi:tetratricopeptide (TPR) repeat protein
MGVLRRRGLWKRRSRWAPAVPKPTTIWPTPRSAPRRSGSTPRKRPPGQAIELAPADPWIQALAGRVAFEKGDYPTAVERLREAICLRPGLSQAHNALAQAYNALGRKQEAQAEAEQFKKTQGANDDPPYLSDLFQRKPPRDW